MPLCRVPDDQAGPAALGILLPPGSRTVLIVRPRSLQWDLLLVRGVSGLDFRELDADEAVGVAEAFLRALEAWNAGGVGQVAAAASSQGGFLVWLDVDEFTLVLCGRLPGQPYRPLTFAVESEAREAAGRLSQVLHPPTGVVQEVYLNTRHFAR